MSNTKKRFWRNFSFARWMKWTLILFILLITFRAIRYSIDSDESVSSVFQANELLGRFIMALAMGVVFTLVNEPRQKADHSHKAE